MPITPKTRACHCVRHRPQQKETDLRQREMEGGDDTAVGRVLDEIWCEEEAVHVESWQKDRSWGEKICVARPDRKA
jgi:hypothetical protein